MSSTYVAVPVISRGSSLRRMRLPTSVSCLMVVVAILRSCLGGRGFHGFHDVLIAGASAEIAFQSVADFGFGGVGVAVEQLLGGHDHAGRAEAALQSVVVPERLLHGVQR